MKTVFIIIFITIQTLCFAQEWRHVSSLPDSSGSPTRLLSNNSELFTIGTHYFDIVLNKSTDNGENWTTIYRLHTGIEFGAVHNVWKAELVDEKHFFLTFLNHAKIAKSTDGGNSFNLIEFDTYDKYKGFFNLKMYDYKTGVASQGNHIYFTRDGWETHDSVDRYGIGMYYPQFIDENTVQYVYFRSNASTVLVNFDIESQTWKEHFDFDGFTKDNFLDMDYTENGKGFLAGLRRNGKGDRATDIMYQSTDFGKSWTKTIDQDTEPNWGFNRVLFNDTLNGFATGQFGKVIMTNDAGKNWHYVEDLDFYEGDDITYGPFRTELAWLNGKPYFISDFGELYTTDSDFFNLYESYTISGIVTNEGIPVTIPFNIGSRLIRPQPDGTYRYTKRPNGDYIVDFKPSNYFRLNDDNEIISVVDKDVIRNLEVVRQKYDIQFEVNNIDNKDISDVYFRIELETNQGKNHKIDTMLAYNEILGTSIKKLIANDIVKITPVIPEGTDFVLIPSELSIDFKQDTTFYFDVLDEKNYSVSGSVTQLGKPMKYITMTLFQETEPYKFCTTDSLGNYRFYNVEEGNISIYITSDQYATEIYSPRNYQFELEGHKEGCNFHYNPNTDKKFTGRVTDKQGNGIKDIRIQRFLFPTFPFSKDNYGVRTNADGYYSSPYMGKKFDFEGLGFYPVTDASYSPEYHYPVSSKSLDGYDFVIDTIVTSVPYRLPNTVTVYPNPVKNLLTIEGVENETLDIYDLNGKRVLSFHNNSQQIDVSELIMGVYFIKDKEGNHLAQFIKE